MAITNKDIEKLKEVFATKEDLKSFATKDDLKSFATKDDFSELKNDIRTIMGILDDVMNELVKAREDRILAIGKDREQDRRLDNVESRLIKVEAR